MYPGATAESYGRRVGSAAPSFVFDLRALELGAVPEIARLDELHRLLVHLEAESGVDPVAVRGKYQR